MGVLIVFVILVVCILPVMVLAALCASQADLAAAGVSLGHEFPVPHIGAVPGDDVVSCAEVAGPEQLTFVGPVLVCTICDRVRTRPGHWVAGGCAPFGGVVAIRAAGKAEECVCPWCAGPVAARLKEEARAVGAMS